MRQQPGIQGQDINRIVKGASREIRDLLLLAHAQNFKVAPTQGNHYSVSTPDGVRPKQTIFTPKTPSDGRGLHRVHAKLRRIGVDIPRPRRVKKDTS